MEFPPSTTIWSCSISIPLRGSSRHCWWLLSDRGKKKNRKETGLEITIIHQTHKAKPLSSPFYSLQVPQTRGQIESETRVSSAGHVCGRRGASEVVGHPADRLDVWVLRLPLHVGAVVSPLHDIHAAAVVGLLVQHPPVWANPDQ